jgi:hypothetical protein
MAVKILDWMYHAANCYFIGEVCGIARECNHAGNISALCLKNECPVPEAV